MFGNKFIEIKDLPVPTPKNNINVIRRKWTLMVKDVWQYVVRS